jgi:hypothetical protein
VIPADKLDPFEIDHIEDEEVLKLLDDLEAELEEVGGKCPIFA